MIQTILAKVIGTQNERDLKKLRPIVDEVGALEAETRALTDEQLRGKTVEFRTRLAVYGGQPMVGVTKADRHAAGVDVGDTFDVLLALDTASREISVPPDLAEALAGDAAAAATFDRLSFSHRREYVQWIIEAKRPETRARRVAGTLDRLTEGEPLR